MDALTLEHAMELFKLPRTLGVTAEAETITTNVGRFGPYVKYGPKYVSLKGEDDPYTITHERALEVIRLKKEADANRIITDFASDGIQVLNGRYGPYVTDGKKNAKIPKDREPKSLTLEECRTLVENAPERGTGRFGRGRRGGAAGKFAGAKKNGTDASSAAAPGATPAAAGPKSGKRAKSAKPVTATATSGAPAAKPVPADAKSAAAKPRAIAAPREKIPTRTTKAHKPPAKKAATVKKSVARKPAGTQKSTASRARGSTK
jgi:DNA topoisomerase-1